MKAFDAHCHLYDGSFDKDRDSVIERAKKVLFGVLNCGENPQTNRKVLELAKRYPKFCFCGLGFHPAEVHKFSDKEIEAELSWIAKQKPLAISEIGLDWAVIRRDSLDVEFAKMRQINWFRRFIELANSLKVPAIIHSRWATKPVIELLAELRPKKAVLHAFSGTLKEAEQAVKLGYKISIGNTLAYAQQKRELAEQLPLDALVLESDSPVLGPIRGVRNEPANISLVIAELARIKKVSEAKVVEITNKNVAGLLKVQPM